jgi:formylglycine-generating enzyme required for sulfatase activity
MKLANLFLVVLAIIACKKADPSSAPKKEEGVTEQPTEVSGGFGLTMQCSVMNREVIGANSSEIGCIVNDESGAKFTGEMKDLSASISAKGRSSQIIANPQPASGATPLSVYFNVDGLEPKDAESIDLSGKFDNKPATLAATLKGRFALICDEDTTYFVSTDAPESNLACTETAPCKKIPQAVALLPDIFNCKVTIKVAAGKPGQPRKYFDQIKISGKQITDKGALKIVGVSYEAGQWGDGTNPPSSDDAYAQIEPYPELSANELLDPISGRPITRSALSIRSFGASASNITIQNILFDGKNASTLDNQNSDLDYPLGNFEAAVLAETAFVIMKNIKIKNMRTTPIVANNSSRVHLHNVSTSESISGVEITDSYKLTISGNVNISGPGGDGTQSDLPNYSQQQSFGIKTTRTPFGSISLDGTFTNLLISGVRTGMWLNQSDMDLQNKTTITIRSTHTGLKLQNNASWAWEVPLVEAAQSGSMNQAKLEIDKCIYTCIDLEDSTFAMETEPSDHSSALAMGKIRPRLTLRGTARQSTLPVQDNQNVIEESTPSFVHRGLIQADRGSKVTLAFLENLWCDSPNYSNRLHPSGEVVATFISETSSITYKSVKHSIENGCRSSNTSVSRSILFDRNNESGDQSFTKSYDHLVYSLPTSAGSAPTYELIKKHTWDQFIAPEISPSNYVSSTAGGDPLTIFTLGFKSISTVRVDGVAARIINFNNSNGELLISPPAHSPTATADDFASLEVVGESQSLAEPGLTNLVFNGVEYKVQCPKKYFEVTADSDLGTSKFCVMSFEAKVANGFTLSTHENPPVVNIPRDGANGAIAKCESIGPYHHLVSNAQWQALARYIANDSYNYWDYDNGGTGIPTGHSDNEPSSAQAASGDTGSGRECFNTGSNEEIDTANNSRRCKNGRSQEPQARYFDRDRTDLWDFAGNAAEWVQDDFTHIGITSSDTYASQAAVGTNMFAPLEDYSAYNSGIYAGLGFIKINAPAGTYGIARGGSYMDGDKSGVFAADATLDPTQGYPHVGFRCVVTPPSTVN